MGSLNIDYTYQVEHIVKPGETLSSTKLEVFPGGKGLNQSVALARAGANVYHAGKIGMDGQFLLTICKENGIDTRYIEMVEERTGNAIIQVEKGGQNSILLYPGANHCLTRQYMDTVLQDFKQDDILVLQNEVNELAYLIDTAYAKGMRIFLNPSPMEDVLLSYPLNKVDTFLMNEVEGYQITKKQAPEEILKAMKQMFPNAKVVLTLGDKGAYFQYQDKLLYQDANKVEAIDTTAAGDTFTGYYIALLLEKDNQQEALYMASLAAALAVKKRGATSSIPRRIEVEKYVELIK